MLYLSRFFFPGYDREYAFRLRLQQTCYDTIYPFFTLSKHGFDEAEFEPVTIFYGGNGSGKTTALNVIAEKLSLVRDSKYNRSSFFGDYTEMCRYERKNPIPPHSRIITSDDVFDFMLNLRYANEGVDLRREELFEEYLDAKYSDFKLRSLDDYERLKTVCDSRRKTQSKFVRSRLAGNLPERSNGESAFAYFTDKIKDGGLYLLDEPENSLSPARQLELLKYLENAVRFFDCQLIIATHSPFILSMHYAKIYDLDSDPVAVKKWTSLPSVREYYDFFKSKKDEFE